MVPSIILDVFVAVFFLFDIRGYIYGIFNSKSYIRIAIPRYNTVALFKKWLIN